MTKRLLHAAAVLTVAIGASACSSVPDWVDPTTWVGDSPAAQSDNATTPDLASIPDKPAPASTPDDQKQVSDSLAADRAQTNYSADQLRGGNEAAAPPPVPPSAADQQAARAAAQQQAQPAPDATPAAPAADAAQPAPAADASATPAPSDPATPPAAPAPSNQSSSAAPPADTSASATGPAVEQHQLADAGPAPQASQAAAPPGAEPAVPMSASAPAPAAPSYTTTAAVSPSDAALGFKPSTAPPLDPSVSQFVSAPIIARYEQTQAMAGNTMSAPNAVASADTPKRHGRRSSHHGEGGPEQMSGAVVANFDALQHKGLSAATYTSPTPASPAAVVFFPGDGTVLNAEGREQVRQAVEAYRASGGQGFIRVIGHSSSRTANMSGEKHLELIFQRSKERADSVARELIRMGIPASHVLEEAVGDSQPVYYESMPKGEDGNRRAEIFLQG